MLPWKFAGTVVNRLLSRRLTAHHNRRGGSLGAGDLVLVLEGQVIFCADSQVSVLRNKRGGKGGGGGDSRLMMESPSSMAMDRMSAMALILAVL